MALISSSYSFPPGLNGVLPITVPTHIPYSAAGTPWMRVPLHFHGFNPASLSAAAYLSSSRARRLGESELSSSPLSKRLAFSPPARRRRGITNFSIEGILGKHDDEEEEEDMKILVVDTNTEPLSPVYSPSSDKDEKHLVLSPTIMTTDQLPDESSDHHQEDHREESANPMARFSWLQCTRYKPPRLPRAKRKEGAKKRKLGRNPRVPFSPAQVATLEQKFRCTHYLSSIDVAELSAALNLSENRVKIWFQNRRARERRDKEATDKGQVTSSIRSPTSMTSSPTVIPSHNSVAATTSATMISLSAGVLSRLPSSPVGASAFTPVTYDMNMKAATAAAALSSIHRHTQNL